MVSQPVGTVDRAKQIDSAVETDNLPNNSKIEIHLLLPVDSVDKSSFRNLLELENFPSIPPKSGAICVFNALAINPEWTLVEKVP